MDTMQEFEKEYDKKEEILLVPLAHINTEHLDTVVKLNVLLRSNTSILPDSSSIYYLCQNCKERYYKKTRRCESCDSKELIKVGERNDTITCVVEEIESTNLVNRSPVSIIVKFNKDVKKTIDSLNLGGNYLLTGKIILRKIKDKEYFEMEVYSYEFINDGIENMAISSLEEAKIKNISQKDDLIEYLSQNIFSNDLYNLGFLMESILLMMASSPKVFIKKDVLKNRGNIMLLLVGSPGTAKSQLLKRTVSFFPKSRYITGSGSSGIGLVASVVKDERVGDYVLKPGALALCHKGGILGADELDKVDKTDLTKMNTQMDSLFIQIDKANIHRRIPADVSILGAMNPKYGAYNLEETPYSQINLKKDFMDRFDLIFNVDYYKAKEIDKIIEKSCKGYLENEKIEVDLDLLRKYFSYVRTTKIIYDTGFIAHITKEYKNLLGKSRDDKDTHYSMRLIDNLIRLACAHSRLRLSNKPDYVDVKKAGELMKESFKSLGIYDEDKGLDFFKTEEVVPKSKVDKMREIIRILGVDTKPQLEEDIKSKCYFEDFDEIIELMKRNGDLFAPRKGYVKCL